MEKRGGIYATKPVSGSGTPKISHPKQAETLK
jgi:hypothetical protein